MKPSTNNWIANHGTEALHLYATTTMTGKEIAARYEGCSKDKMISYAYANGYRRRGGVRIMGKVWLSDSQVNTKNIKEHVATIKACDGSIEEIVSIAAYLSGIGVRDLFSPSQTYSISRRRWRVCYLLRQAGLSYPKIGKALGLHHTACIYGVQKFEVSLSRSHVEAA